MAHRGKSPYFFWRDLCGELPQTPAYIPYRNCQFERYGWHSPLSDWLHGANPCSKQGVRDGWEQRLTWDWDLAALNPIYTSMRWEVRWEPDNRTVYNQWDLVWVGGSAVATKLWQQPPNVSPVNGFDIPMLWDTAYTSDPDVWGWGTTAVETRLRMMICVYADIPDPPET